MKIAKSLWTLSIKNPSQAFYFTDRLKLLMLKKYSFSVHLILIYLLFVLRNLTEVVDYVNINPLFKSALLPKIQSLSVTSQNSSLWIP